jgi:leucyl-tRNA synthetase
MELFGPDFEFFNENLDEATAKASEPFAAVDKAKKGKIVAKATGHTYQFQIMESINVPRSEIKKFADPLHWLTYFPPIAIVICLFSSLLDVYNTRFRSGRPQLIWLSH